MYVELISDLSFDGRILSGIDWEFGKGWISGGVDLVIELRVELIVMDRELIRRIGGGIELFGTKLLIRSFYGVLSYRLSLAIVVSLVSLWVSNFWFRATNISS